MRWQLLTTLLFLSLIVVAPAFGQPSSYTFDWQMLKIGAGGWVTGIDVQTNIVYARTDVAGAYRWNEATASWTQVMTADSMPDEVPLEYGGVISIVSAPSRPQRVYMTYRDTVYRSDDNATTFTRTAVSGLVGDANSESRQIGERLAVDPANPDLVYYGSPAQGLYQTSNGGGSWSQIPRSIIGYVIPQSDRAIHEIGIVGVVFDRSSGSQLINGVQRTPVVYVASSRTGVYRSVDGGSTWASIGASGPGTRELRDIEIANDGTVYVTAGDTSGIWRYRAGAWQNVTPPTGSPLVEIAVEPTISNRIFAFQDGGAIWRSNDGGTTWQELTYDKRATDIPYLAWLDGLWMSVGGISFDPSTPGRLWFAEGFGVWRTQDISDSNLTWNSVSAGIEELVNNDIVVPPGGAIVTAHWDNALFYLDNPAVYPSVRQPTGRFNSAWDVTYSAGTPTFLAATVSDHRFCCPQDGLENQSGYSTDGGRTWQRFASLTNGTHPASLTFGNIAVAANDTQNLVWLPSGNAQPYYTRDRGANWTPITLPGAANSGSHFQYYLNRRVLTADFVQPNTFYLYHADNGIYRSTDGGATWARRASTNLPTGWAVGWFNGNLQSVPSQAGHLFFTPGRLEGQDFPFYRSLDGGETWQALPGTSGVTAFGFGGAQSPGGYPALYMQGFINGDVGVWMSLDRGDTWNKIATYSLGIYAKANAISGDMDEFGVVYFGFDVGFAVGRLRSSSVGMVTGTVSLQGRTSSANVPLRVRINGATERTATTDGNGRFTLSNILLGSSAIWVKHDQYLAVERTLDVTANTNVDFGTLRAGDVNNDNAVSLSDFSILASGFNRVQGQSGFDGRADLNGDGTISLADFSLLASNFNQVGASP
jgi:photosystem II stability/assembly factor-like uncharacterized protein/type 1 fimbria pilin